MRVVISSVLAQWNSNTPQYNTDRSNPIYHIEMKDRETEMKYTTNTDETTPPVPAQNVNRPGSWQSRRKMITMWIFLILGWVIVFGHLTTSPSAPQTTSSPPVAAQPAPPVILPPVTTQTPLPAPLPTLPPVVQPAPVTGPLTTFGSGTYEVGVDIKPGKNRGTGDDASSGYWARLRDTNGTLNSIIANDLVTGHQTTVTISKTDAAFDTNGITWTLVKK